MTDVLLIAPAGPRHASLAARIREAGYVVTRVDAAASFVREMRFLLPTVAIVHAVLQEEDGIHLVAQARRQGSPTTFVVTTDAPSAQEWSRALGAGAARYLATDDALAAILAELRSSHPGTAPGGDRHGPIIFEGLEFTREMRSGVVATRGGAHEFHLPPKQAALLWFLARHAKEPFSTRELLQVLYGPGATQGPRRIAQLISALRRQIEPPSSTHRYLHTHEHGYRFEPMRSPAGGEGCVGPQGGCPGDRT